MEEPVDKDRGVGEGMVESANREMQELGLPTKVVSLDLWGDNLVKKLPPFPIVDGDTYTDRDGTVSIVSERELREMTKEDLYRTREQVERGEIAIRHEGGTIEYVSEPQVCRILHVIDPDEPSVQREAPDAWEGGFAANH